MTKPILKESALRSWVRKNGGDDVLWVEKAKGGTDGMQDCFVMFREQLIPLELKRGTIENGKPKFTHRLAQQRISNRQSMKGIDNYVLMMEIETSDVYVVSCVDSHSKQKVDCWRDLLEYLMAKEGCARYWAFDEEEERKVQRGW